MADKSGGDVAQLNSGLQGNASLQDINSIAAAGVGAVGGMGGSAASMATGSEHVSQSQTQLNGASAGDAGSDNVHADTNVFGV